jgi:hypoxanthine phosphoribosyltransferase
VAILTLSGDPQSPCAEIARCAARSLNFELIERLDDEFLSSLPSASWPLVATSTLAGLATEHHLLIHLDRAERLFPDSPHAFRVRLAGRDHVRVPPGIDLALNAVRYSPEHCAAIVTAAFGASPAGSSGLLTFAAESQIRFRANLQLAGHGIAPPEPLAVNRRRFSHPSEEVFANLLDFYCISWVYEPRSFPIEWDAQGKVVEAFTPDFYLPEFGTYVELTTMKQSLVTRKNRKIRRVKELYPEVSIQIFYQKDFENLIFKYGLSKPPAAA